MRSEASVEIDAPIEEVFDLTINHVPQWSKVVVEDTVVDAKPDTVGTKFRVVTEDRGRRMEFDGVVTACDPPRFHAIELTGSHFDLKTEYRFDDLSGRTRVTQIATANGKGLMKIPMALLGWMMSRSQCCAAEQELLGLKAYCEDSHAATS